MECGLTLRELMRSSYSTVFNLLIAYSDRNARAADSAEKPKHTVRDATQEDIDNF